MNPRKIAAFVLFASTLAAAQQSLPVSRFSERQSFASVDDAADAALALAMRQSLEFEHGGIIVERDGAFYYSDPVSNNEPGHIRFHSYPPPGSVFVAIYHTHPGDTGSDSRLFSPEDIVEAETLKVPSYIGVLFDGTIRRYDPGRSAKQSFAQPGSLIPAGYTSEGSIIKTLINI